MRIVKSVIPIAKTSRDHKFIMVRYGSMIQIIIDKNPGFEMLEY